MSGLLAKLDPTGDAHRALGRQAAETVFARLQNGAPHAGDANHLRRVVRPVIARRLQPLGCDADDVLAALLLAGEGFGPRMRELADARHEAENHGGRA